MARLKLTALSVDRLQPSAAGRAEYFDATLPGFGLRVTDNGIKTWIVMYRAHGRQRRLTLGRYPALTLADAREDARAALRDVARGLDPADGRLARKRQTGTTMKELVEQFVEQHAKRHTRRWKDTERLFKGNVLPALGHRDIRSVTRHDVLTIIEGIVGRDAPATGA